MSRRWVVAVATLAAAVGLSYVHPFGNPRVERPQGEAAILRGPNMPAAARAVLMTKCADCHSTETRWPVYSRIAPGSWLIDRDIVQARKHMDLSRWDELAADDQQVLAAQVIQVARIGEMPPLQYRALHWRAKLTQDDIASLSLLKNTSNAPTEGNTGGPGDAAHGKLVFEKRCTGCHALNADHEGPRLAGVYGRRASSIAGFEYSPALRKSGLTWTDATLDPWLTDPDVLVPGNNMEFHVPKADERRDLIAYLKKQ